MRTATASFLQLQLGQEVVYLLLAAFSLISLLLGLLLSQELVEEERVSGELVKVMGQRDEAKSDLARTSAELATLRPKARAESDAFDLTNTQRRTISSLTSQLEGSRMEVSELKATVARLNAEKHSLSAQLSDKPPIINLSEAQGYTFSSGDNQLSDDFRERLLEAVVPKLLSEGMRYKAKVIEVIGHTDEVRVPERFSNLDSRLVTFLNTEGREQNLIAGDNTGLGMARAAAVARVLMAQKSLTGFVVLPLSAGQVIDVEGHLSRTQSEKDVRERRRIEIRLRR